MEEEEKDNLRNELEKFESNGIKLKLGGKETNKENIFRKVTVVNDNHCCYMRNYVFKGSSLVEVDFRKIRY